MKDKLVTIFKAILLIILDQISKLLFYDLKFLENFYFINSVLNKGISWGINFFPYSFVILFTILFLIGIFYSWMKCKLNNLVFILLFSGAVGNLIDRIFVGGVRDFIDLHFWPVFNLADIYLTIGIILLYKNLKFNKTRKV